VNQVKQFSRPYTTADINANARPTQVQKFGDSPVAANPLPIFSSVGARVSRRLFNT